jgi:tetratricopeptide (TPR) repeat protein
MAINERTIIINKLFKENKWIEARNILLGWFKEKPGDHWALTRLSSTYAEEGDFAKALECLEKALKIEPNCSLALSDYTESLYMLNRHEEAILICKRLIKRGVKSVAYGTCAKGLPDARKLINDTRYTLGMLYGSLGEYELAGKYIKQHIANRNRNCRSAYKLRDVKKVLSVILEGNYPY